jgi:hypothetical protein
MSETNKNDSTDNKSKTPDKVSLAEIDNEVADILAQNALGQQSEQEQDSNSVKSVEVIAKTSNEKFGSTKNVDKNDQLNEKTKIINESIPEPFKLADKPIKYGTNVPATVNLSNIEIIGPANPSSNTNQMRGILFYS